MLQIFTFFILFFSFSLSVAWAAPQPDPALKFSSSKVCGTCHKDIHGGWKGSMHAHAVSDPVFDSAFREASQQTGGKSDALCLSCHAPTTRVTKDWERKDPITMEGVTCDFCHSVKGINLSSSDRFDLQLGKKKWGPLKGVSATTHETGYADIFEQSRFCGACHEYTNEHGVAILETHSEWKKSPQAKKGIICQTCHMPKVKGFVARQSAKKTYINSHEAAGGHSVETIKKAVTLKMGEATRTGDKIHVVVHLENVGSGHKVPTGIPTRKLVLKFQATVQGTSLYSTERVFQKVLLDEKGKVITKDSDVFLKAFKIKEDTRLEPGKVRSEHFTFIVPSEKPIEMEASLHYVYQPHLKKEFEMKVMLDKKKLGIPAK